MATESTKRLLATAARADAARDARRATVHSAFAESGWRVQPSTTSTNVIHNKYDEPVARLFIGADRLELATAAGVVLGTISLKSGVTDETAGYAAAHLLTALI